MTGNLLIDRLFVIDDDPILGRLIETAAASAGFEVNDTKSPIDFIENARGLVSDGSGTPSWNTRHGRHSTLGRTRLGTLLGHAILISGADSKVMEAATHSATLAVLK